MLFAVFSPALAAGAAAAAIGLPLLIHLLFRKRYQIVPWAAIRFLLVAERRHRRRIDQWLLLALRILALLLPLVAMVSTMRWVEPLWQAIKPGATETIANIPRTHHVLVLDASLSMTARTEGGQTRFDKAVAEAEKLIRSGGPGDGYTLLVLAGGSESVVPGPSNDPDKVVAELKKVKPTHAATDTATALPAIADILARSPRAYPRRQVTFLTDAQRSAWTNALPKTDAQPPEVWQRIFSRAEVTLVDVAQVDVGNLAITDIALVDPIPLVDSHTVVAASVANHGSSESRNVRVQLLMGRPSSGSEALVPIQQTVIDVIQPGGRASIAFRLEDQVRFREKGIHVLQVKLMESDDLPADDVRSIAVLVRDGIYTILVDGSADPDPFRRSAGYLARALFPPMTLPSDAPARPRTMTPAEFADPAGGDITGEDCVYLCDLPHPTLNLAAKLESLLKRGGGVIVGLGPNAAANIALYNRVFYNDGNGILPGPIGD
ncbi:MAG TPA: VWA domain-containing protein, partial [Gemmata sp.]|nr:VWA domain-containing protein [Gemmata sp.]